jgi:hypothetical protein
MARLGPVFFAHGLLRRSGRLRFDNPLGRRAMETVFEVADAGLLPQDHPFQPVQGGFEHPATRTLRNRLVRRWLHRISMTKASQKRKPDSNRMNG